MNARQKYWHVKEAENGVKANRKIDVRNRKRQGRNVRGREGDKEWNDILL